MNHSNSLVLLTGALELGNIFVLARTNQNDITCSARFVQDAKKGQRCRRPLLISQHLLLEVVAHGKAKLAGVGDIHQMIAGVIGRSADGCSL